MVTEKFEEILEAIWTANENNSSSVAEIQERCMIDFGKTELAEMERGGMLISKDDSIVFTAEGKKHARLVIRRHRLAEVLVKDILKLRNEEMEEVACKMEHSLIAEVEQSICTLLGHPQFCPDGNPIPPGKCCTGESTDMSKTVVALSDFSSGEKGKISYIKPGNHSNLHQLMSMGLHAGVHVTLNATNPAYCLQFDNTEIALDKELADHIFLWKSEDI